MLGNTGTVFRETCVVTENCPLGTQGTVLCALGFSCSFCPSFARHRGQFSVTPQVSRRTVPSNTCLFEISAKIVSLWWDAEKSVLPGTVLCDTKYYQELSPVTRILLHVSHDPKAHARQAADLPNWQALLLENLQILVARCNVQTLKIAHGMVLGIYFWAILSRRGAGFHANRPLLHYFITIVSPYFCAISIICFRSRYPMSEDRFSPFFV
jgi:hypothetical protein